VFPPLFSLRLVTTKVAAHILQPNLLLLTHNILLRSFSIVHPARQIVENEFHVAQLTSTLRDGDGGDRDGGNGDGDGGDGEGGVDGAGGTEGDSDGGNGGDGVVGGVVHGDGEGGVYGAEDTQEQRTRTTHKNNTQEQVTDSDTNNAQEQSTDSDTNNTQ